jgi:hypothetical protein
MKPSVQKIITKLAKEKVELSTFSDFERAFDKANDGSEKIGLNLIDELRKAEVKYKQNISNWETALKFGKKIEEAYKDLGTETPSFTRNQIASCKAMIKEEQRYISAIKGMYSKF